MNIYTADDVKTALDFITSNDLLTFDCETTGLNVRKDKIIGFGFSNAVSACYVPILRWNTTSLELEPVGPGPEAVQTILLALKGKGLITFNGSYDCRIVFYDLGVYLVDSIHTEVMLLKHLCNEDFPLGLKDIAASIFGDDSKDEQAAMKASIKVNGGSANQYFKADLELMATYCKKDCTLTYRVYEHYLRDLRNQGLEAFYYTDETLPLYKLVTIPMEMQGVAIDVPAMQSALNEICDDLQLLESEIQDAISPYVGVLTMQMLDKEYPLLTAKTKKPSGWTKKFESQLSAWADANVGRSLFNLSSKLDLAKLFFDVLKLEPLSKTPTGRPQVDAEFLDSVAPTYAWAAKLVQFNKLNKLKSTYIEGILEEQDAGIFYPSFHQHRTVSGRYAGNLQQLPRPIDGVDGDLVAKHTNRIREFIVPRAGNLLMSADYEQLEPSIFSHTSGDLALQAIFNSGDDFYSTVAIRTEKLEGVSADKSAPNYLGKVNKAARQKAKAYSLGIAYGMSGYKLAFEIEVPRPEAEKLVSDYLEAFPQLAAWMLASKQEVLRTGQIATQAGRIRHMPQAMRLFRQYGNDILDDLALWKRFNGQDAAYKKAKEDRKTLKNLVNNSINFQVQGLAASIVSRASISLALELRRRGLKAAMCMQVHDEICLDVPMAEVDEVSALVKQTMQTIVKLAVPLRTTPQFGANFRDCK